MDTALAHDPGPMRLIAENYERNFVPLIGTPMAQSLLAAARPRRRQQILDLACGTGLVSRMVLDIVGTDGAVTGLDVSPAMLAVAADASPAGIEWVEGAAEHVPLPDESFDLVLCCQGMHATGTESGPGIGDLRPVRALIRRPGQ